MKIALLAALLAAAIFVPVPHNVHTNAFPNHGKQHAMLRLEDVGPGGSYETPEDLGKLRAVFEYLAGEDVPFHVATISRSKHIKPDGTWYEKGIDDPNPDETVQQFIQVLKSAQERGAVLGMHGYTHQYGDVERADAHHITGTGNEFDFEDVPETQTPAYAEERIKKSLNAFAQAGFVPGFWESPHYHDTREQEEVFRSYMGILYQPDLRSLRSLKDLSFHTDENRTGGTTLGSVYVPAPLKYISDPDSVEKVLKRLPIYKGLGAMYYHPFLEFPSLEAVTEADGKPRVRDGLPEFRYKVETASNLHLLVDGFRDRGYEWMSLYEVVPFSPAHRVELPLATSASDLMTGDVTGNGHADVVMRDPEGRVSVISGSYKWPRNQAQRPPRVWLNKRLGESSVLALADTNGDRKSDLIVYERETGDVRDYYSDGLAFGGGTLLGTLPYGIDRLFPADANGDGETDLFLQREREVWLSLNQGGKFQAPLTRFILPEGQVSLMQGDVNGDGRHDLLYYAPEEGQLHVFRNDGQGEMDEQLPISVEDGDRFTQAVAADTDGDGRTDVMLYDAEHGLWQVLRGQNDFTFAPLDNLYGPWALGEDRVPFTADFDGNGRGDIASYDPESRQFDLSLSFRTARKD